MGFKRYYDLNLKETKEKIKKSVKFDNLLIQAINNIDELNRVSNTLIKRLREWYELYNPEFSRKIQDHEKFVELILEKKDSKPKDSMGADLKKQDFASIIELAKSLNNLYSLREKQEEYLENLMQENCPNIAAVAGSQIGARLIAIAGDLKRLMQFPASTVQLLGAEKALFRHMKNKKNRPPKFGVIHEHPLVINKNRKQQGRVARTLADKIALAAKIDYFKGDFIGDKLRKEVEERFK